VNAAANIEIPHHRHGLGTADLHKVVKNPVDDIFMKSALFTIRPKVKLERLELDTQIPGDITNPDRGEVRLAGPRTHASKLRALHADLIVSARSRV
jgi:hypothetical protein